MTVERCRGVFRHECHKTTVMKGLAPAKRLRIAHSHERSGALFAAACAESFLSFWYVP